MGNSPKPSARQLEFMDWELGAFFHFGVRTFNEENRDWDMEPMSASSFMPSELDCESWLTAVKAAGMRYAVLTAKHHDGFANWQSAYTEFSVKNSPWKGGRGDVVREFTDACRRVGVKVGLYYSCAQFDTVDMDDKYDDFVVGQITELLTNYGDIDILWFDTCGSQNHVFDSKRISGVIRSLAPDILVFGPWGSNIRWIGNEWGYAPLLNSNNTAAGFVPGECDCCMTRRDCENFWFYNEGNKEYRRTPDELMGMYCYSVGRGANLLLNIAPDRRGLLPETEKALLDGFARERERRFVECRVPVKSVTRQGNEYCVELERPSLVDTLVMSEELADGEHIHSFEILTAPHRVSEESISVYTGLTVGHKRICTFPTVRAKLLYVVTDTDEDCLSRFNPCYVGSLTNEQILG